MNALIEANGVLVLAVALHLWLGRHIWSGAVAAIGIVLSGMLGVFYFAADGFTGEGVNAAVIYHLSHGLKGAGLAGFQALGVQVGAGALATLILAGAVWRRTRRGGVDRSPARWRLPGNLAAYGLLFGSVALQPALADLSREIGWQRGQETARRFDAELAPIVVGDAAAPRNLLFLYVESLERTYFDERRFPGLMRELAALEREHALTFTAIGQAALSGWTIAGMVASQCGIPLGPLSDDTARSRFVSGATCLGDVLSARGFHVGYVGGADLDFAGKGRFLRQHGFKEVLGLEQLREQVAAEVPLSPWGLHDDTLLEQVFRRYRAYAEQPRPFALVALTLDTHPPSGHETPACSGRTYGDGRNRLLNAVSCADHLVAEFIRRFLASPQAEDTLLVVASDHLTLQSDTLSLLRAEDESERRNLFMVFGGGVEAGRNARWGTTLDIAPTVLHLMGMETAAFALGRNLLTEGPTLVERFGSRAMQGPLKAWREQVRTGRGVTGGRLEQQDQVGGQ